MSEKKRYLVVGSKPWNKGVFDETIIKYPGDWYFIGTKSNLTCERVKLIDPRYIFFLHWSWKIPTEVIDCFECVCFHMTDVPYGRGGSPLQNLIIRDHRKTKLTALRMTEEFDAGPVYLKEALSLEGNAEEIYIRSSELAAGMIKTIISKEPEPSPQAGEPVLFKRRKPEESKIPPLPSLLKIYDFIRMLDAEEYPRAFLEHEGFQYSFRRANLYDGKVIADVVITQLSDK